MIACFTAVSAKFMFDNDINAVSNPSDIEEYKDFIRAIDMMLDVFGRVLAELPLYKIYNNQVARMYQKSITVS